MNILHVNELDIFSSAVLKETLPNTLTFDSINLVGNLDLDTYTFTTASLSVKGSATLSMRITGTNPGEHGAVKANTVTVSDTGSTLRLTLDTGVLDQGDTHTFTLFDTPDFNGAFTNLELNQRYQITDNQDGTFDITHTYSAADAA